MRKEVIGTAELYLGDCREVLSVLPTIDAVVTDPPYGLGPKKFPFGNAKMSMSSWDSKAADIGIILDMQVPSIIFGGNYFSLPPSRCWLVWDKETSGVTSFADAELAWTNLDKAVRLKRHLWSGPYMKVREERFHPAQKPVSVMEWAIEHLPKTCHKIFDPFMGSGTTGVACVNCDKMFVGIEMDEGYFDIACRRIDDAQRQGRLIA